MDWQTLIALLIVFACAAQIVRFFYKLLFSGKGGCHSCGSGGGCGSKEPVQIKPMDQ